MSGVMPAIGAAGGMLGAAGALVKGQMTANSLLAQAKAQELQATEARQAGDYNAFRSQLGATAALGRAEAAYGASGVSSGSVSEQSVLMAGATNAELDRQNIIHGADIKAINYENEASLNRFGANSALQGSYFSAIGSLLGGSASALSNTVGPSGGSSGSEGTSSSLTPGAPTQLPASLEDPSISAGVA